MAKDAGEGLVVRLSGVQLMQLLHEGEGDVEGLLLGRRLVTETRTLRDDSCTNHCQMEEIRVDGMTRALPPYSFYGNDGAVSKDSITSLVDRSMHAQLDVVGWYVCRPDTPLRPSIREKSVLSSLQA